MHRQAGLLALGSAAGESAFPPGSLTSPGSGRRNAFHSPPSPITAAGPPRIRTGFRIAWRFSLNISRLAIGCQEKPVGSPRPDQEEWAADL